MNAARLMTKDCLDRRFVELDKSFARIEARFAQLETKLTRSVILTQVGGFVALGALILLK